MIDQKEIKIQKPVKPATISRGEQEEIPEHEIDWDAISEYELENENGSKIMFNDVYGDYTTIVIFIRHFLCVTAKEYVDDLAKIPREVLGNAKVRLALIGCGKSKFMKQFRRETGYWAEFYTDPERELYTLMGLKCKAEASESLNLSQSKHVKSGLVMGMLRSAWRATQFPGEYQGDTQQLGGAFIMGPGNSCSFQHQDKNPADHTPINTLLKLVGLETMNFEKDRRIMDI